MIAHLSQIDLERFVLVATAMVVLLLHLYRRSRLRVRARPLPTFATREARNAVRQVAALPVRVGTRGELQILVISTRGSGRWTVPKGWPMRGRSDAEAAAQEAYEEAGVRGIIATDPLGTFEYVKRRDENETLFVTVYRLDVTSSVRHWRERGQRKLRWLAPSAAADCVAWPGLAEIIRSLETAQTT